ncbi:hypothetical protein RR48_10947 [Papilio machaon]|uniref:Uncharacterized protein n=1 Tax=Papilio machaon TaxID=76193 RepID=A0A194R7F8_PAPMA|nr:hypothetical protein RR48_10947 [Papilio machaon]
MGISKTKNEFEKDIIITNYDVSQCYKSQKSEERFRIDPKSPPMKAKSKKIICNCYNTDLETGVTYNVPTTRNQTKSVYCQCATNNIPSDIEKYDVFNKVSYSKFHENANNVNRGNIKTLGSQEETRIVTEYAEVTNQKLCSTPSNKSNIKDVICGCDQLYSKNLSSYEKVASRRNYKTVICQCSMSNFLNDEARYQNQCNTSEVFKKISQNDLNRNEYDDDKNVIQRKTSREMIRVVAQCSEQTNEIQDRNSQLYRKNRNVTCECYLDSRDIKNALNQYKVATKVQTEINNCQCSKSNIQTNNDRQQFESTEQQICRKTTQENFHQTCCPCPKPLEPRLQQAPQIRRSSINFNGKKTLKYKEPFNLQELPVHGVQTSDHSIRFVST